MSHESAVWTAAQLPIVEGVRTRCMAYPETIEREQFGRPWFKAGKRPFCVVGQEGDAVSLAFSTTKMDQDILCQMEGFRPTPYMHQHGYTTLDVTGAPDWKLIEDLLETAYRNVALKRMLKALDS